MFRFQSVYGVGLVILVSTCGSAFATTRQPADEQVGSASRTAKAADLKRAELAGSTQGDAVEQYFECAARSKGQHSGSHAKSRKHGKSGKYSHSNRSHRRHRDYDYFGRYSYRPSYYRDFGSCYQDECVEEECCPRKCYREGYEPQICEEDECIEEYCPRKFYREDCTEGECDARQSYREGGYRYKSRRPAHSHKWHPKKEHSSKGHGTMHAKGHATKGRR